MGDGLKDRMAELRRLKDESDRADKALEECLQKAVVEDEISFTALSAVLGITEAGVRVKATRKGWYEASPGSKRRPRRVPHGH